MKKLIILIVAVLLMTSCTQTKVNEQDIANEVLNAYNDMYQSYGEGTVEFFKYFEDDFLRVTPSGKLLRGVEDRKADWSQYLKSYSLALESFDKPEIIVGEDQVVTIGGYIEYFIDRETKDSSRNRGIYVATWRKQEDGAWKISMDTWHSGLDKI